MTELPPTLINPVILIQPTAPTTDHPVLSPDHPLATLPNGATLTGFVINRDGEGNPVLRTPLGDFTIRSEMFLKTGIEVVIRVDNSQVGRARIVTVDALSPENYIAQATRGLARDTIAPSPLAPLEHPATQGGAPTVRAASMSTPVATPTLAAILLTGNIPDANRPPLPPALAMLAQLPTGTPLTVTVLDVELPPLPVPVQTLPPSAQLGKLLTESPATPALLLPPASLASSPALPHHLTASLPPTPLPPAPTAANVPTTFTPMLATAMLSGEATPLRAHPAAPTTSAPSPGNLSAPLPAVTGQNTPTSPLSAPVIGYGEDGSNILQTRIGSLKLFTPQPLPTGTLLRVLIAPDTSPPLLAHAEAATFAASAQSAMLSPRFAALLPLLMQATHSASDAAMLVPLLAHLPVIGPKFTSGVVAFLAAAKSGALKGTLPTHDLSELEAAMPDLLRSVARDLSESIQPMVDPAGNAWKAIHLPLIFGADITPAQLYVRDERHPSAHERDAKSLGDRFILNLTFSALGALQMDGLMRGEVPKQLDLYVRTETPLDPAISDGIRTVFSASMDAAGIQGNLLFQQGLEHFALPHLSAPAATGHARTHTLLA